MKNDAKIIDIVDIVKPVQKKTDVHTAHCCKNCGCKYGDDDCSVTTGMLKQEFKCGHANTCDGW